MNYIQELYNEIMQGLETIKNNNIYYLKTKKYKKLEFINNKQTEMLLNVIINNKRMQTYIKTIIKNDRTIFYIKSKLNDNIHLIIEIINSNE